MGNYDESCSQNIPEGLSYVFNHMTTKLRDWRFDRLFRDVLHEDKENTVEGMNQKIIDTLKPAFFGISKCRLKEGDWPVGRRLK
jgi:hypothetical protein